MFGFGKKTVKKVMLVEDDALLAKVLSDALEKENFKVEVVTDAMEVVNTAEKIHPFVILLDLILPGLDGFEVLKKLKANRKTSHVPVAIISNLDSVSDIKSTKVLGAETYFIKANVNPEEILEFVRSKATK